MNPAQQLAQALYNAGFRGADLIALTSIGMAESGANLSTGNTPGQGGVGAAGEVGPLQIHPVHFGTGAGQITPEAANTYQGAANYAAYLTYGTPQGLTHWSTYTQGTWKAFATRATDAINSSVGSQALQGSSLGIQPGSSAVQGTSNNLTVMPGPIKSLITAINSAGQVFTGVPGGNAATATVSNPPTGLSTGINAVGDFLNNLRQPSTLWRVALTFTGIGLIGAGLLVYFRHDVEGAVGTVGGAAVKAP